MLAACTYKAMMTDTNATMNSTSTTLERVDRNDCFDDVVLAASPNILSLSPTLYTRARRLCVCVCVEKGKGIHTFGIIKTVYACSASVYVYVCMCVCVCVRVPLQRDVRHQPDCICVLGVSVCVCARVRKNHGEETQNFVVIETVPPAPMNHAKKIKGSPRQDASWELVPRSYT